MSQSQSILVSTLACSTLLLTGALSRQDLPPPQTAPSLFTPQSAPADARPLLQELSAKPIDWLSATVWQKMSDGENNFEATGTLLRAPNNRFRMQMEVRSTKSAQLLIVSDGVTLQRSCRIGSAKPIIEIASMGQQPGAKAAELHLAPTDLASLLRHVCEGLREATVQSGLWQDLPVLRISGAWAPRGDTPSELRPPVQPRTCNLYLDARTHWPIRVEWQGSESPHDAPVLLLQMEFRDLSVNQPLSDEEAARLFCIAPQPK